MTHTILYIQGSKEKLTIVLTSTPDGKIQAHALGCVSTITQEMADKIMAGDFDFESNCYVCGHSWGKHGEVEEFGFCPK